MSELRRARWGRRRLLTVLGLAFVAALLAGGYLLVAGRDGGARRLGYTLVTPRRGPLSATVNASGAMQPREVVSLTFGAPGTVAAVLVEAGDTVARDAPLARLDGRELELRIRQARAALDQASAGYEKLRSSPTAAEVAAAQAQLDQARAQLRQVQGNVTARDIAAARAQIEQARANLARLQAGPKTAEVQAAQAQLAQAQATLQGQRDSLSAAKTRAESQLEQAANALRNAQDEYSRLYWQNRELAAQLDRFGRKLPQDALDREAAALRAVQNAEESQRQARVALEQARQAEQSGVEVAEAQVISAQAALDQLLGGADADQLAAARAQLAQAEANLGKLLGDQRAGSLAAAEAAVTNAEANLARLAAGPLDADLASARAQVASARAALEQAELALEQATLRAPFAGTVAEVNLKVGETPGAARPAIVLADLSGFYVDITVDEIDVARLAVGQPVTMTLDALPDLALRGEVTHIGELATQQAAVTSYSVRIETRASDPRVRSGMSANADIVVAEKEQALLVPRRAVRAEQGRLVVDIPADQSLCGANRAAWPASPQLRPVVVTTGLSNELVIEIASGEISEGTCIYVEGVDARLDPLGGPPPGARSGN